MGRSLLAISYRFPPQTYPLAMRLRYFLSHLQEDWSVEAVTAAENASIEGVTVHHVRPREARGVQRALRKLRLTKFIDWFAWPDVFVLWVLPALFRAWRVAQSEQPAAILTFTMPFSTGLVGVLLKKLTGLPLVINLNDSPTCSDMNSVFPSALHHRLAYWLEDWFVRNADALVYVSRRNMERVRDRQPEKHRSKFHLIRRGVRPLPSLDRPVSRGDEFRLVYTGGMGGWYFGRTDDSSPSLLKRLYTRWENWGKVTVEPLDPSTHSPIYVGKAIRQVLKAHPEWKDRVYLDVYGNTFPDSITQTVLDNHGLQDIVRVHDRVPHETALRKMQKGDLLFMTLPGRPRGTPGGRISAKTYEYLMTDRPILAALPPGENTEYLEGKPGVFLTDPSDVEAMADVISDLAQRTFAGEPPSIDRSHLRPELSSQKKATEFETVLRRVLADAHHSVPRPSALDREAITEA